MRASPRAAGWPGDVRLGRRIIREAGAGAWGQEAVGVYGSDSLRTADRPAHRAWVCSAPAAFTQSPHLVLLLQFQLLLEPGSDRGQGVFLRMQLAQPGQVGQPGAPGCAGHRRARLPSVGAAHHTGPCLHRLQQVAGQRLSGTCECGPGSTRSESALQERERVQGINPILLPIPRLSLTGLPSPRLTLLTLVRCDLGRRPPLHRRHLRSSPTGTRPSSTDVHPEGCAHGRLGRSAGPWSGQRSAIGGAGARAGPADAARLPERDAGLRAGILTGRAE